MLLAYGLGSAIGPISISTVMNLLGANGIFYCFIFVLAIMGIFMMIRVFSSDKAVGPGGGYRVVR